jgi:hypothetical protein
MQTRSLGFWGALTLLLIGFYFADIGDIRWWYFFVPFFGKWTQNVSDAVNKKIMQDRLQKDLLDKVMR